MTTFPLYNSLEEKIPNLLLDLSSEDKDFFTEAVSTLELTEHELIYALIRYYQIQHETEDIPSIFPYGGKKLKKGIKFDFEKLPIGLQYILLFFVRLHLNTLNEGMA